ncbi:MAG: ice-binding family protein [Candidatus Dormibacteria bacterium]
MLSPNARTTDLMAAQPLAADPGPTSLRQGRQSNFGSSLSRITTAGRHAGQGVVFRLAIPRALRRLVVMAAVMAVTLGLWPTTVAAATSQPPLGTAANYTVMAATTITNTGSSVVTGNLALAPSTAVTGFPPGTISGSSDIADAAATQGQTDLGTAYTDAAGATPFVNMPGGTLGGQTLTPGVYRFSSSALLTGTVTLNGEGSTNPTFIFQIGSTLTTASGASVVLINGAGACAVFWQVGSSATLGTSTSFQGNLMALTSITLDTGANIGLGGGVNGGRALARNGALTLDANTITPPSASCTFAPAATATPTPTAAPLPTAAATPTPSPTAAVPVPNTGAGTPPSGLWLAVIGFGLAATGLLLLLTATVRRRRLQGS